MLCKQGQIRSGDVACIIHFSTTVFEKEIIKHFKWLQVNGQVPFLFVETTEAVL